MFKRIFLIVCDGMGIGEMPDAIKFGDVGSNTLKSCMASKYFKINTLNKLGLLNINQPNLNDCINNPIASYGKCTEASIGKDTVTGHWEMMGIQTLKPFPTFPNGFPDVIIKEFEKQTGKKVIVNKPYSGTEVIKDYGNEHLKTGDLIVYTSADSVFQIAAHTDIVPINDLYKYCQIARNILQGDYAVGRVIARPFTGRCPFIRCEERKDFALVPPKNTLNYLQENNFDVIGIGPIKNIFNNSGLTDVILSTNNEMTMKEIQNIYNKDFNGLCFANLEDFDMLFGHRNDIDGYAKAISQFDNWLDKFIINLKDDDLLIITADHGNDPGTESTDHSREYTPLIVYNKNLKSNKLGTRKTFSDIGKSILDNFNINNNLPGLSFMEEINERIN